MQYIFLLQKKMILRVSNGHKSIVWFIIENVDVNHESGKTTAASDRIISDTLNCNIDQRAISFSFYYLRFTIKTMQRTIISKIQSFAVR